MSRRITSGLLGLGLLGLAACGGGNTGSAEAGGDPESCEVGGNARLGLATGNVNGVYFALGNALATQVADATEDRIRLTAAETGASVQNIEQLVAGDYQVAFSLLDSAADAVAGTGSFTSPQPVRALARIYTNYTHVIARNGAGVENLADLKGKRVSTGSPKSGTEVIAQRTLSAAGLDPDKDVKAQRLDLVKTVDGMKDGTIDAMFFSGGLPTPGVTDLLTTGRNKVSFLDITGELADLKKVSTAYQRGQIPAAVYGTPKAVPTVVVPNVLLVRDDLAPNVACQLTKTLFDVKPGLVAVNKAAEELDPELGRQTDPVPLHPGAERALDLLALA